MQRKRWLCVSVVAVIVLSSACALAQRGGGSWPTIGNDAQRTAWNRTDAKISADAIQKSGFRFLWKLKLDNQTRQLNSLTQPLLLQNIISYKGFKALAYVGGSSDNVYSIDYDLSKMFWSRHLDTASAVMTSSLTCPGGLTAITRAVSVAPPLQAGGGGRGAPPPGAPPAGAAAGPAGGRGGGSNNSQIANAVYVVSSGGAVHTLNPQTGEDLAPPVKLLPPHAKVVGSVLVDNVFYAATADNCGGAANGVWAVDLASDAKTIANWQTVGASIAGSAGPAFGTDGTTFYVTTANGAGGNSVVALEPRTLMFKETFAAATPFTSSPVVFQFKGKDLLVASNADGRLYLLDASSLGGTDGRTPLFRTSQYSAGLADFTPGALATWEDPKGTRFVLVASAGPIHTSTSFPVTNGSVSSGALVAFKLVEESGLPALEPAWISRDMVSPQPPMILNNVVFAVSSGEFRTNDSQMPAAQRAQRSRPAVLYALDAATGRELWNSGNTITSFAHGAGPSGGDSQVYVITYDGTLYAFGVPLEH